MNFSHILYAALISVLGSTCLLFLGCSFRSEKLAGSVQLAPTLPASPPAFHEQEERTNARLKGLNKNDQKILQAENHFIEYLTANSRQKEILRRQILSDTIFIQSLGRNCPGHLPYLATYLQYKYKAAPQPNYSDPWQQAIYDYIISRPNLAQELTICQQYRTGLSREFSAINHIEVGMLSRDRAEFLCNLVAQADLLTKLKNKSVADIGGGAGILLSKLAPYVRSQNGGNLICIDIEPKLAEFSHFIGKYDSTFNNIDYRLTEPNTKQIPLKNKEAYLICLFDVHNIYDKFSPLDETQRCLTGQQYLANLKKSLKDNGFILIYDSEELMASAEIIERIAKDAGFTVQNLCIKEANGHYLLKLTKK